jgi:hypothetical protein
MSYNQVANLDFQQIKTALKEFLRAQSDFTDYDFEGSSLSILIDLLAYNTYYTAFNTNMVANELFLSSATLRDNVVALAKQLGYRPRSASAPSASINFDVTFTGSSPDTIFLRKGTGFNTIFDESLYQYVVIEDQEANVVNNIASFRDVQIYEGSLVTNKYIVNTSLKSQRFIIENPGADISTVRVRVFESNYSSYFDHYEFAENILNVEGNSKVFYIEEIDDERYEIFFGDGVFGRSLENGEVIEVSYLVTNGPATNGARSFTFSGVLEDLSNNSNYPVSINILTGSTVPANGGETIEAITDIKFKAPRFFGTQNRAVTAADYASIIVGRNIYPAVSDIISYGGEEEDPPQYGVVKVVIKPKDSPFLSSFTKNEIVRKLRPFMVGCTHAMIVDPSILYIELDSTIYYDRSRTTQRPEEIRTKVISAIERYTNLSDTEKFNGKFRYSKFICVIDEADKAINSNQTLIKMRKDFYAQLNLESYYEVCYQNAFDRDCLGPTIESTGFTVVEYPNDTVYLTDNAGKIVLYKLDPLSGDRIVLNDDIGTVDYVKGEVRIPRLTIIRTTFDDNRIELRVKPLSNDVVALRNVFLDVDIAKSKFTARPE